MREGAALYLSHSSFNIHLPLLLQPLKVATVCRVVVPPCAGMRGKDRREKIDSQGDLNTADFS